MTMGNLSILSNSCYCSNISIVTALVVQPVGIVVVGKVQIQLVVGIDEILNPKMSFCNDDITVVSTEGEFPSANDVQSATNNRETTWLNFLGTALKKEICPNRNISFHKGTLCIKTI